MYCLAFRSVLDAAHIPHTETQSVKDSGKAWRWHPLGTGRDATSMSLALSLKEAACVTSRKVL